MTSTPQPTLPPPGSIPFIKTRDNAPAYWDNDILWLILASGEDTGGRWSMMEELCPKGSGAPPHMHIWSDETFYVIEGEVTFLMNGEISKVAAGSFVVIPRNTVHGFRVDSEEARVLNSYTPASWETAVVALAEPALSRTIPPRDRTSADRDRITPLMKAFGMTPVPGLDPLRPSAPDAPYL
jgi:quercetin dioxygenase-like cupin family protein